MQGREGMCQCIQASYITLPCAAAANCSVLVDAAVLLLHTFSMMTWQRLPSEEFVILLQTDLLPSAQLHKLLFGHPKDLFKYVRCQKLLSFMWPLEDVRLASPDFWIRQIFMRIKHLCNASTFFGGVANNSF